MIKFTSMAVKVVAEWVSLFVGVFCFFLIGFEIMKCFGVYRSGDMVNFKQKPQINRHMSLQGIENLENEDNVRLSSKGNKHVTQNYIPMERTNSAERRSGLSKEVNKPGIVKR
jgi:hypothetical protein